MKLLNLPSDPSGYAYLCPECGSENLDVTCTTTVRLEQSGKNGDFQTLEGEAQSGGDHEWDDTDNMACRDCGHSGIARDFDAEKVTQLGPLEWSVQDAEELQRLFSAVLTSVVIPTEKADKFIVVNKAAFEELTEAFGTWRSLNAEEN